MFIKKVSFDFNKLDNNSYLKNFVFFNLASITFRKKIVFITGDNQAGKSTLIETLAYNSNLNRKGGSKNFVFDEKDKPDLVDYILVEKNLIKEKDSYFFRSDTFFNLREEVKRYSTFEGEGELTYNGGKSFDKQSHGESFLSFFKNRIGENGLYLFDEPETALSFDNQLLFLFMLKEFEKNNNQIIIVTHSPILLSYPNAQIINLGDKLEELSFEETDQFRNYSNFFENYKRYQKELERED